MSVINEITHRGFLNSGNETVYGGRVHRWKLGTIEAMTRSTSWNGIK
ncbi:hypothetical protein [Paenibacillus sp. OAS669]|nr:hypothetical protein [Paenibacillus sp. OAS669]MBE1446239.1 hypothetical protein [Paenibacillus sp. OAS669]